MLGQAPRPGAFLQSRGGEKEENSGTFGGSRGVVVAAADATWVGASRGHLAEQGVGGPSAAAWSEFRAVRGWVWCFRQRALFLTVVQLLAALGSRVSL